ncbi:MAG: M23 family metallopeptidase, partial [Ardenticatenaceae bacterium]
ATMDGVVRIAGTHPAYSDMLVQIRHREHSPYLYSNYLHMNSVVVSEGDLLTVGDLIGYSGESATPARRLLNSPALPLSRSPALPLLGDEGGFDHLHFEFREGCVYQECNRHPWGYLPYSDTLPLTPTLSGANLSGTQALLLLDIESAPDQLDLDGLELSWGSQTIQLSF